MIIDSLAHRCLASTIRGDLTAKDNRKKAQPGHGHQGNNNEHRKVLEGEHATNLA